MKNLLLIIAILLSIFCNAQMKNDRNSSHEEIRSKKIRIDPSYAQGGNVSQIFDSVRYIPLETSKECLFGKIDNLQVSEHYFVFFDFSTRSLFVFDRQGNFHAKINKLPIANWYSENDYLKIANSFVLDQKTENIYIIYIDHGKSAKKKLAVFNPNGKLIIDRSLPNFMQSFSDRFSSLSDNKQLFANTLSKNQKDSGKFYFYVVRNFDSIVSGELPVRSNDPLINRLWDAGYHYNSDNGTMSIWNRSGEYSIISFNTFGKDKICQFIFPALQTIDSTYYNDTMALQSPGGTFQFFSKNDKQIKSLNNVWFGENIIAFSLNHGNSVSNRDHYLYFENSGRLINFYRITTDSLSYNLPISSFGVDALYKGHIFNALPSYLMFSSQKNKNGELWKVNSVLNHYFTTQGRKSNSVIVELCPKANL